MSTDTHAITTMDLSHDPTRAAALRAQADQAVADGDAERADGLGILARIVGTPEPTEADDLRYHAEKMREAGFADGADALDEQANEADAAPPSWTPSLFRL